MCIMLRGILKETVGMVVCLSRLAYQGFVEWYWYREDKYSWEKK